MEISTSTKTIVLCAKLKLNEQQGHKVIPTFYICLLSSLH